MPGCKDSWAPEQCPILRVCNQFYAKRGDHSLHVQMRFMGTGTLPNPPLLAPTRIRPIVMYIASRTQAYLHSASSSCLRRRLRRGWSSLLQRLLALLCSFAHFGAEPEPIGEVRLSHRVLLVGPTCATLVTRRKQVLHRSEARLRPFFL